MKIIKEIRPPQLLISQVACLGYFDGLHLGHQKLIAKTLALATKNQQESLFLTFSQAPKKVITKQYFDELMTLQEKKLLIKQYGFNNMVIFPFNETTKQWSADDFIKYLQGLNITTIVIGKDFRFGFKGVGSYLALQKYFQVILIDDVIINGQKVSSSLIRSLLKHHQLEQANNLLTRKYKISSSVMHGKEIGRLINFPTANLHLDNNYNLLPQGVYITHVKYQNKIYRAISCIFITDGVLKCESYLFDFNEMIYGKKIEVLFLKYLRNNVPIKSLEHLKQLITNDKNKALEYFHKIS